MRSNTLVVALTLLAGCASAPAVKASAPKVAPAAPASKPAEPPEVSPASPPSSRYRLESIEVIGSHRYSREELLAAFGVPDGRDVDLSDDALIRELKQGKERLLSRFAFAQVRCGLNNYEDTHAVYVTVNLVDVGDEWRLDFDPVPDGAPEDPDGLVAAWALPGRTWRRRPERCTSRENFP
ncbi:hypothetical protein JY651_06360 [Pyxidicoccus parkwayensis]|uniref:Lipoprotein n=1 Tax=Pyxidicoccus parkwayensis TaxID=2813578 RepID=A0ABX7P068_9BACT|nr:hypothetical protein [Pyxidicoccus parkwaysis]QSQ24570.1 hypothetical protein JY651_06360 [Pyxidicoccus parkwaysis]